MSDAREPALSIVVERNAGRLTLSEAASDGRRLLLSANIVPGCGDSGTPEGTYVGGTWIKDKTNPAHPVPLALLEELDEPMLTSTLSLPGEEQPLNDAGEIRDRLEKRIDLVIEAGSCGLEMTTVVDLTGPVPVLVRAGLGALQPLGLG